MSTVQQAQGIDNFFDALFAFMRRKTDLFTKADQARGTVNQAMEKNIKLFQEDIVRKEAITRKRQEDAAKQAAHNAAVKKAAEDHKVESSDAIMEVSEEEARQIELEEAAKKAGKTIAKAEEKKDGDDDEETMTLEEKIEEERRALPSEGLIPVTFETFTQWKKDKAERK